jgi:hypothetical protein
MKAGVGLVVDWPVLSVVEGSGRRVKCLSSVEGARAGRQAQRLACGGEAGSFVAESSGISLSRSVGVRWLPPILHLAASW